MKFEIKHRYTGEVLFSLECGSMKLCLIAAVKANTPLRGADLHGADLHGAYLGGADLGGADLRGADLHGAIVYRAGCHEWESIEEALAWYGDEYPSNGDRVECIARLNMLHSEALRRWPAAVEAAA